MNGSRADRQKGGRSGQPWKLPSICRDGIGTCMVVRGKAEGAGGGIWTEKGKCNIIYEETNIINGLAVS